MLNYQELVYLIKRIPKILQSHGADTLSGAILNCKKENQNEEIIKRFDFIVSEITTVRKIDLIENMIKQKISIELADYFCIEYLKCVPNCRVASLYKIIIKTLFINKFQNTYVHDDRHLSDY